MTIKKLIAGLFGAALVIIGFRDAYAGDFEVIANAFARSARHHKKVRVAVLPFHGAAGYDSTSGLIVSERLMIDILQGGVLQVVERSLLQRVMQEQRLEANGIVDSGMAVQLGKILGVDAIITGTVIELRNSRVEVNARMIDARTAQILSAGSRKIEKDWIESSVASRGPISVPVPPLMDMARPAAYGKWIKRGNDATWGVDCDSAMRQADQLERSMIELKARYWASRMRNKNFSMKSLTRNPGSDIKDPEARSHFYDRLRAIYRGGSARPLSEHESETLFRQEKKIRRLSDFCRS